MKLALVVQRYGAAIAGGSEAHCRELAVRLAGSHDVTVLTTCATDYVSWDNALAPGESIEDGVRVIRFPVSRSRRMKPFAEVSDEVFSGGAPPEREEDWFRENGPHTPALLDHLRSHGTEYDVVLFWAFRYFPTYFGLPLVADRAILVPTAEEDPAIALAVLYDYFQKPSGYLFLTVEEKALVAQRTGPLTVPSAIIGMGLDAAPPDTNTAVLETLGLPARFILYLGRVDRNKGCHTLLDYFQEYLAQGGDATLVLAGPSKLQIPTHPSIRALGHVSDEVRDALLTKAHVLIVPSPYESLSIVLLEAWNRAVPALVNARCRVLEGQVRRANGGLHFRTVREFSIALDYLLEHDAERNALGRQGLAYVEREYRWPVVLARVESLLADVQLRRP